MFDLIPDRKIDVLAIVGPTATGKTKLAIKLAKMLNGAIISADSMQVYKHINIGTATPTKEELEGVLCYLVNLIEPTDEYFFSVASFVSFAKDVIFKLNVLNKYPIICGGTGLYVDSLINNIHFFENTRNEEIRKKLETVYKLYGIEPLFKEFKEIDPEAAARIHPNNAKRVIRALEFYFTTGISIMAQVERSGIKGKIFNPIYVGLNYKNKENLKKAIYNRITKMLENGLLNEVKTALNRNYKKIFNAAIGYKEFVPYVEGKITFSEALEKVNINTRKYAKRQVTWFKRNKSIKWFYVDEYESFEDLLNCVYNYVKYNKSKKELSDFIGNYGDDEFDEYFYD